MSDFNEIQMCDEEKELHWHNVAPFFHGRRAKSADFLKKFAGYIDF